MNRLCNLMSQESTLSLLDTHFLTNCETLKLCVSVSMSGALGEEKISHSRFMLHCRVSFIQKCLFFWQLPDLIRKMSLIRKWYITAKLPFGKNRSCFAKVDYVGCKFFCSELQHQELVEYYFCRIYLCGILGRTFRIYIAI